MFKYVKIITDMIFVEEQKNETSINIAQLINDYNLYKQGRDLLTRLKLLKRRTKHSPKRFCNSCGFL